MTAGILLGNVFFHLIPEAAHESTDSFGVPLGFLAGLGVFGGLDVILHRSQGHPSRERAALGYLTLVGDGFHNFIDGLVIGTSYLVSPELGLTTTLAIVLHELPQEFGESGTMVYSGFSPKRVVRLNFLVSLTALAGVSVAVGIGHWLPLSPSLLLAFTAGGFFYVALGRLAPELLRSSRLMGVRLSYLAVVGLGLGFVLGVNQLQPHVHHHPSKTAHQLQAVPFGFVPRP
ncbi:putative: hypothetical protein [Lunatimonas lonarensis]|uniref:Zinc transporter, ZIP family n=2 Tax=Lunatimonas lonarensis TaxID=1232681 RepID=R7ZSU0_9BACT|nr:putative: hypothetical protein [Lunatimonas lonarensis]